MAASGSYPANQGCEMVREDPKEIASRETYIRLKTYSFYFIYIYLLTGGVRGVKIYLLAQLCSDPVLDLIQCSSPKPT